MAVVGAISVIIGVLVTGAGPHSGDAESIRNGLDLELWQHLHSYPAYVLILLVIAQAWILWKRDRWSKNFQTKAVLWLLVVLISQAAIGVAQARLGVPPLLVGLHMLGAAVICSMLTFQWLAIRGKSRGSN